MSLSFLPLVCQESNPGPLSQELTLVTLDHHHDPKADAIASAKKMTIHVVAPAIQQGFLKWTIYQISLVGLVRHLGKPYVACLGGKSQAFRTSWISFVTHGMTLAQLFKIADSFFGKLFP